MTDPSDAVIEAMADAFDSLDDYCRNVQGFHYGADFVMRDCNKPWDEQEIYRGPMGDHGSMQTIAHRTRLRMRLRVAIAAYLAAVRGEG